MAKKLKTFVDLIDAAFQVENVTAEITAAKAALTTAVAGYVSGNAPSKGDFNKACQAAVKAGADKATVASVKDLANAEYGNWAWGAYADMVTYGTDAKGAAALSSVDQRDMDMLIGEYPVKGATKENYGEKYLPSWLTKERVKA